MFSRIFLGYLIMCTKFNSLFYHFQIYLTNNIQPKQSTGGCLIENFNTIDYISSLHTPI